MKTKLTTTEDEAYYQNLEYYRSEGYLSYADELAWQDLCMEFPRLKKYEGPE